MTTDTATRKRVGNALVVPLTDLVNASLEDLEQSEELQDASLQYILVDASTYERDSEVRESLIPIMRYASLVGEYGKRLIIFNIGEVLDRDLSLSKGYKASSVFGARFTNKGLYEAIAEYCKQG